MKEEKNTQLNILTYVLEDDEDIILLLDQLFKMNGFVDYVFFKNAKDFVRDLNERVHICVIDYRLSGPMNGIEVMKVVLSQYPWCKVIMISGQDDPKVITQFVNSDGFRYVSKNDDDYTKQLVDYMQQAIEIVKNQISVHKELQKTLDELKSKRKK